MPNLNGVIAIINTAIGGVLNVEKFQGGELYNQLVELVPEISREGRTTKPGMVNNYGEVTSVVIDDTLPYQIYHRLTSLNEVSVPEEDSFGDEGDFIEETANMVLILISDRNKILMRGEDLLSLISVNIPKKLNSTQNTALNFIGCEINIESANTNMEEVYQGEYSVASYGLKPNSIMYAINYKIITTFGKECFQLC